MNLFILGKFFFFWAQDFSPSSGGTEGVTAYIFRALQATTACIIPGLSEGKQGVYLRVGKVWASKAYSYRVLQGVRPYIFRVFQALHSGGERSSKRGELECDP